MPVVLDRLPLPNLTLYTGFSIVLLACSVYYAGVQVTLYSNWKDKYFDVESNLVQTSTGQTWEENATKYSTILHDDIGKSLTDQTLTAQKKVQFENQLCNDKMNEENPEKYLFIEESSKKLTLLELINEVHVQAEKNSIDSLALEVPISPYIIPDIIRFMFHEPLCIWTLINMAYCILILLGTAIQRVVFGELRVSEQQHIKDKFWNFVFYKFIFVFGVMNVQAMDGVVLWCSWFSVLGFLHLLAQLCEDRFEYLSFSLTTPKRTHMRLLGLLGLILLLATACLFITVIVGLHSGINTFAFMAAECILLIVRTLYIITRYCIYLWDISHEGLWEGRARYVYFTGLMFELSELTIDMVHHIHMVIWANMLLTMASLVICMQVRFLFYQLQHKIKSHRNYMRVDKLIKRYREVHRESVLPEEETCAICWENVSIGRLLDCNHLFHSSCLLLWLHHDVSCPTCRHKLAPSEKDDPSLPGFFSGILPIAVEGDESDSNSDSPGNGSMNAPSPNSPDGSSQGWRYVSWLSSFSVEQSHTQLPRHHQANAQTVETSQLDNLARQVQQMFTDVAYSDIYEDLRHTRSIEDTIDNILEHRLHVPPSPPPMFSHQNDFEGNSYLDSADGVCIEESKDSNSKSSMDTQELSEKKSKQSTKVPFFDERKELEDLYIKEEKLREEMNLPSGSRFSKSSEERESLLAQRKEALISKARLRYLSLLNAKRHSEKNINIVSKPMKEWESEASTLDQSGPGIEDSLSSSGLNNEDLSTFSIPELSQFVP